MKRRLIATIMALLLVATLVPSAVLSAKTVKKIANGGYLVEYDSACIKGNKLIIKGTVENWERAASTPEYSQTGTFKFKLKKNCEILDGYKSSEETITASDFNSLCETHDGDHSSIAFMIKKNKVTLIRFW